MIQDPGARNCCSAIHLRTWRPMVLWSAGIVLALGLAWFVGAVVVQAWQALRTEKMLATTTYCSMCDAYHEPEPLIERLGGPACAAARMRACIRSWVTGTEAKRQALALLCLCGKDGIGPLTEALKAKDPILCEAAVGHFMNHVDPGLAREAVPALEVLLVDRDASVREAAARVLKNIRGGEPPK